MTAAEHRENWNANKILRAEWDSVLQSPACQAVFAMVEAEAIEDSEMVHRMDGDPILARNLSRQIGARRALKALRDASLPPPEPVAVIEEYAHITPDQNKR